MPHSKPHKPISILNQPTEPSSSPLHSSASPFLRPHTARKTSQDKMGRKLGFSTLLFRTRDARSSCYTSSWAWPYCKHPRTYSFRAGGDSDDVIKTVNSVYFDSAESCFSITSEEHSERFSTASDDSGGGESLETVIRGLRSERLFFEPGSCTSSSILEEAKTNLARPFRDSVALAMESEDPYRDFRTSMEEMVVAHGLKDWEGLEELLVWYLRVNGKKTHGYILGAFVDLLGGLASSPSPCSSSASLSFGIE